MSYAGVSPSYSHPAYGDRVPVRLDTYSFSDDIEAELNAIGDDDLGHENGLTPHEMYSVHTPVYAGTASEDARARAVRDAAANPAAYAEAHFSHPAPAAPAAAFTPLARQMSHDSLSSLPSSTSSHHRSLSSSSAASSSHPSPAAVHRSMALRHFAAASLSGRPAEEHDAFYDDDSNYFNLGGSSFPLLPHNSLFERDLQESPGSIGGVGPETAFSPSGRVHAQHFTSILNQPSSGFLRENATRAVSGATAYLPSLASLWTFTTGVAPPTAVTRASEDIASFAEENVVDPGPFVSTPCPGLDDVDMSRVLTYMQQMKSAMASYARHHPESTLQAKLAADRRQHRKRHGYQSVDRRKGFDGETIEESEFDGSSRRGSIASALDAVDSDSAATIALNRELSQCYASIPAAFFDDDYLLSAQEFWRDEDELSFMAAPTTAPTRDPNGINPYASFASLASYHASPDFHLPSIAEQKASQLRAHHLRQDRALRVSQVTESHMSLQQELSSHLDLVELNLQQQIARKSGLFFDALKNMHRLQSEVADCLRSIATIREQVRQLKIALSDAGLGVIHQVRTKANARRLIGTLELMATVLKTSPTVQVLLATGDFTAGLQLIQSTRGVLARELKGVTCLRHVETKLAEHAKLIHHMMAVEFCGISIRGGSFLSDLGTAALPSSAMPPPAEANGGGMLAHTKLTDASGQVKTRLLSTSRSLSEDEEDRLVPLVSQLVEIGQFQSVFDTYTRQLQQVLKQRIMELVYELMKEVTKEESESVHDGANGASTLTEADANSLLDDAHATTSAESATPVSTAHETVSSKPSTPQPLPSTDAHADAPPTEPRALPRAGERRQAAVAMPVQPSLPPPPSTSPPTPAASPAPTASSTAQAAPSLSTPLGGATNISSRFSSLSHTQFLSLLQSMFTALMDLIQRASTIRHLAVTCIHASAMPSKESMVQSLNEPLSALIEYVHSKVSKIVQTRSSVNAALTLPQFRAFLDTVLAFIQEGEKIAGKTFYGLRGSLLAQAKAFLAVFHTRAMHTLTNALETEKWSRVDVPPDYQAMIDGKFAVVKPDELAAAVAAQAQTTPNAATTPNLTTVDPFADTARSTSDSGAAASKIALPTWKSKSWSESEEQTGEEPNGVDHASNDTAVKPTTPVPTKPSDVKRVLFVSRPASGDSASSSVVFLKFPVVHALLVLLRLIGQYVDCSSQLQAVGSDLIHRLAEMLQTFNSRSCQLVLGAGAMHLAGLKSITATHLALSSQSVGLLVTQIPVIRSVLASRLPPKHHVLLSALDRVSRDCEEHQKEIFAKLTAIMDDLIRGMSEKLEMRPWTKADESASQAATHVEAGADAVDECVRTLMKQTCSLHRALSDLLLAHQRDDIFRHISGRFLTRLTLFVDKVDMKKVHVKTKVAHNVNHIVNRLRTCTGVAESDLQQLSAFIVL